MIVAKGKKVTEFNMKKSPPTEDELLKYMLGPTGNLRAPTLRTGQTVVVGFNPDAYDTLL